MELRFHVDDDGELHIYSHDVTEAEVEDVLRRPLEQFAGRSDSMIAHGMTRAGRYLKVIYSPDDDGDGIFVVTAFDLPDKQIRALKRRTKRRRRRP